MHLQPCLSQFHSRDCAAAYSRGASPAACSTMGCSTPSMMPGDPSLLPSLASCASTSFTSQSAPAPCMPPALQREAAVGGSRQPSEDGSECATLGAAGLQLPPIHRTADHGGAVCAVRDDHDGFTPSSSSAVSNFYGAFDDSSVSQHWRTEAHPDARQRETETASSTAAVAESRIEAHSRVVAASSLSMTAAAMVPAGPVARPATEIRSRPPRGAAAEAAAAQSAELDAAQILSTFPSLAGAAARLGVARSSPTA